MADTVWAVTRALRSYWTAGAPVERFGYTVGALLMVAGLFHLGVLVVDGGPWHGPVSWRKPAAFGLSFGLTVVTLTWLSTFLAVGPGVRRMLLVPLAVASAAEVALVSLQQWRGVPSHFNTATGFDAAVFGAMGLSIAVIMAVIVAFAALAFMRLQAPPSIALAVRAGMLLLVVAQWVGVAMINAGTAALPDPAAYAAGGVLKLPHAVTLHGVQVLPGLAWLLSFTPWRETRRVRVVGVALTGHAGLAAVAAVVAGRGLGPLAARPWVTAVAVVSALLLAAAVTVTVRGLASAPDDSRQAQPVRSRR